MSGWRDYGFPDVTGVPIQTALEGLAAAVEERIFACAGIIPMDIDRAVSPIAKAILYVENGLGYLDYPSFMHGNNFVLPDGTRFTLANAAAYLGEELIEVPRFPRTAGYDWSDPFPVIGYDWIMQRYRIVNLLYKLQTPLAGPYLVGRTYSYHFYSGQTVAEAWENANEAYEEETHPNLGFTLGASAAVNPYAGGYTVRFQVGGTTGIPYGLYIRVPIVIELELSSVGEAFNSFGTGLTEGLNTLRPTIPQDVAYGDIIDYGISVPQLIANLRGSGLSRSEGFEMSSDVNAWYDLRSSLEFYDPTEGD